MPKSPEELRRLLMEMAFEAWIEGAQLTDGDVAAFASTAIPVEWARAIAETSMGRIRIEDWPRVIHPPKPYHGVKNHGRNTTDMHATHKLAISYGRADKDDAFAKALHDAKPKAFTQTSLAAALGCTPSLLTMYKKGERAIPLSRAKKIEKLTGWAATAEHWPGGILNDAGGDR